MSNKAKKYIKIALLFASMSSCAYAYINNANESTVANAMRGAHLGTPELNAAFCANILATNPVEFHPRTRQYIRGFNNIEEVTEVFDCLVAGGVYPEVGLPMPVHPLLRSLVPDETPLALEALVITEQDILNFMDDRIISRRTYIQQANLFLVSFSQLALKEAKEVIKNIENQSVTHTPIAQEIHQSVINNIHQRVDNIGFFNNPVAAGSEDNSTTKGVWVSGIYGVGKQSKTANTANYNSKVFGSAMGIDANINDNNIVGASYSHLLSNYRYNNINKEVNAKSNVLSFYSQTQINDSIIWDNILSFSLNKVKVKNTRKVSSTLSRIATGEYDNKAYTLESNIGYKISSNNGLAIVPNIGIRVSQSYDSAYTEKGVGVQNVKVKSHSDSSIVGIIGARIAKKIQFSEDTEITPILHASIENNFSKKQPKINAGFVWMGNNQFQSQAKGKKDKLAYNIGADVLARHKNVKITASYNAYLQKKYKSHQGQIKLKILF